MSWVKRVPPADPDYFCNCPPCPFCFVWDAAAGQDRAEKKGFALARLQPLALPVLAGIAFVLTVGITRRYGDLTTPASERFSLAASPAPQRHTAPVVPAIVSHTASESPAPSRADSPVHAKSVVATAPMSDPTQSEVPISLSLVNKQPDGTKFVVLHNVAEKPLFVTITLRNASAQKYWAQLPVGAADVTRLLPASPGDRITLSSAGYRDQVTEVY
jgi:hypothetical protein